MGTMGRINSPGRAGIYASAGTLAFAALVAAAAPGCGDDPETNPPTTASSSASSSVASGSGGEGTGGAGTGGETTGGGGGAGGAGGGSSACVTPAKGPTRGSAIALSPDESTLVSVNRDVGTVSVIRVDYADGQPKMTKAAELDVGKGSEPWQVAIDGCGKTAYVVLRRDQKVVRIDDLAGKPAVGASVPVGSEPTGIAISPNNTKLYVANWVDGTLSVLDPEKMTSLGTVDLNVTLAATGLLGAVQPRAALAHPRALAITNNGDASDADESVLVTEWFAQRTGPETLATADTNKKGLVYKVSVLDGGATTIDLPPIMDTGFNDHNNAPTGCFPNQVGSVTVDGTRAYVTSTCASPKGPIGVFAPTGACTTLNEAQVCGQLGGTCNLQTLTCNPNTTDVKTTTHPALTIIDLATNMSQSIALDRRFSDAMSTRMPLLPSDLGFFNGFGYATAVGSDGVFRLVFKDGNLESVGSQTNKFINLRKDMNDALIRLPIGIATGFTKAFAFVANEGSRDVTALDFNAQAIAGNPAAMDFRIEQSSALPPGMSPEEKVLKGKRFFTTGLGRWSLNGEAWGSCAACHIDGLSDNVTWYFARGPRQSTSIDGSFASKDPNDQRIFNWTAIVDEIADFEGNTRGVSGGLGAIVNPANTRINTAAETPPQQGLQGSSADTANPNGTGAHPHSVLTDWEEITAWVKTIRSPRKPTNLVAADVTAGKAIFTDPAVGNCVGCHSGPKWTISTLFYIPGDIPNAATNDAAATSLSNVSWNADLNGFPATLFPVKAAANLMTEARMRFGAPPGAEQIQCALRPVGTFGKSSPDVSVLELRQDMTTAGQGDTNTSNGFNVPSLLGMQVGAPYFHAGNARTLEEVFDDALFNAHHSSAIAQVFTMDATKARQLTAYVLSIDEDEMPVPIPAKGNKGGSLCFYP